MFTQYNDIEDKYELVQEPDPSLTYSYADYLKWSFEERLELIKGKIFKMSPAPNLIHQKVNGKLFFLLYGFLRNKKCKVFAAPFDVRFPSAKNRNADKYIYTVVQPDICVVCDESKLDERGCCGAPELIVEILSPGNSKKEVRIKYNLYEEHGVNEYWIVNPAEQNIIVSILDKNGKYAIGKIYADGDVIESKTIKGFKLNVSEIFKK